MQNRRSYRNQDTGQFRKRIEAELGIEARRQLDSAYSDLDELARQYPTASEQERVLLSSRADRVIDTALKHIGVDNGRIALFHVKMYKHFTRGISKEPDK